MTNQQGAPEALRTIRRFYRGTDCMAENQSGDWVRYEDHLAALVEAQQPAPSAAAALSVSDGQRALHEAILNRLSHAELLEKAHYLMELNSNQARTIGELQDLVEAAPQPSPTPQADSAPGAVTVERAIQIAESLGVREYGPNTRNWSFEYSQLARFVAALTAPQADSQPAPVREGNDGTTEEHPAARRMREDFEREYGHHHPIASALRHYYDTRKGYDDAWNRDREKPVTLDDVLKAEREVFSAADRAASAPADSVTALEQTLLDWEPAHRIAYQAAAVFRPSYFDGSGFRAHNWVVEAIRTAHLDGQRFARDGSPPSDRSGALTAELRNRPKDADAQPVSARHPTVVKWRNDGIEACAKIAEAYGFHDPARDMRALLSTAVTQEIKKDLS